MAAAGAVARAPAGAAAPVPVGFPPPAEAPDRVRDGIGARLRDGIDLDEVRDVLRNYLAIEHHERLVLSRDWSLGRYSQWLARAIASAICR